MSPLKVAGIQGIKIKSGDGVVRRGHPILAACVGGYPEQCLATGTFSGDSPKCDCPNCMLGMYPCEHPDWNLDNILDALDHLGSPQYVQECCNVDIKLIQHLFWQDLPYVNIFLLITLDILHQLHQGVVKHFIGWLKAACGPSVIDELVQQFPPNHSIWIFNKGITSLSRVSGTEHRQISSFLLGILIDVCLPDGGSPISLILATWVILDFLYLVQYPIHTSETLVTLEHTLDDFQSNKYIYLKFLGFEATLTFPSFILSSTILKQLNFLEQPITIIQKQLNGFILTLQRMLTRQPIIRTSLFRWQNGSSVKKRLCIMLIFWLGNANCNANLTQRQMPQKCIYFGNFFTEWIWRSKLWTCALSICCSVPKSEAHMLSNWRCIFANSADVIEDKKDIQVESEGLNLRIQQMS